MTDTDTDAAAPAGRLTRVAAGTLLALALLSVLMVVMAEFGLRRSGHLDAEHTATDGATALADADAPQPEGGCPLDLTSDSFSTTARAALCVVQDQSTASAPATAVAIGADPDDPSRMVVCVMVDQPTTGLLSFLGGTGVQTATASFELPTGATAAHAEEVPLGADPSWDWCPRR